MIKRKNIRKYLLAIILIFHYSFSQVKQELGNIIGVKAYSKEISLFRGKAFVIKEVLGLNKDITKFELDPIEAASSGEITTLYYYCEALNKEGIVFGFYGDYVNEFGLFIQGYSYKNFEKSKALELLQKIEDTKTKNSNFLLEDGDNNNVYLNYDDLIILIYRKDQQFKYRIFWKSFDSEWGDFAFRRTKSKFEKKIK
jgi:hypothetical protein